MTQASPTLLAHGVGRIYESPIPVWLYLAGAGGTVLLSFLIRALAPSTPERRPARRIAGAKVARGLALTLRAGGLVVLVVTVASAAVVGGEGGTLGPLLFWVGLVVGMALLCSVVAGSWAAADPWATLERVYRIEDAPVRSRTAPWWLGPLLLYGLFWFELVSGEGFDDTGIVLVLILYSAYSFSARAAFGATWKHADPFSILFGFAGRIAPFELTDDGINAKGPIDRLDEDGPMPRPLFLAVFVLLASTTLDNVRETVGWSSFLSALGIEDLSSRLVGSLALAAFIGAFVLPFLLSVAVARRWLDQRVSFPDTARRFGWSLIPIGIAYLLAHNAPLLLSGVPAVLRGLSDLFDVGWNLLGTATLLESFSPSPQLVWFIEVGLIVGGHILGVLAAHRTALRLSEVHIRAVRSQYALMALMTFYTVATLWLLSQPLVV